MPSGGKSKSSVMELRCVGCGVFDEFSNKVGKKFGRITNVALLEVGDRDGPRFGSSSGGFQLWAIWSLIRLLIFASALLALCHCG